MCNCVITQGTGVTVTGSGSASSPYVISTGLLDCDTVRACLSEGLGVDFNATTGVISRDFTGEILVAPGGTAGTRINSAIATLPSNGGTILLGAGTYTLDTKIATNKYVKIKGMGPQATLIQFDAAAVPVAIGMADTTQRKVDISNMRINTTTGSDNTGTAIEANYFINSEIDNVWIGSSSNQTPNIGIDFNVIGTYYNNVTDCRISVGGASSVGVRYGNNANANAVRNTKISGDGSSSSIQANGAHSLVFDRVMSDTIGMAIGIDLQTSAHDVTMVGCYLEGMGIGLKVASGVESVRFNGYISTSGTADVQDNGAISLTIDNSWNQFNPYSSLDRTGVVKNKINGTNVPGNVYAPDDFSGIIAWDFDPVHIQGGTAPVNGTVYLMRIKLRYAATITNLLASITNISITPTAGQTFMGLYTSAGTQVGVTADLSAATLTAGFLTAPMTAPYAATAGEYWVALVHNAATPAQFARASASSLGSTFTLNSTAANRRFAVNGTLATALPASFSPASNGFGLTYWVSVN